MKKPLVGKYTLSLASYLTGILTLLLLLSAVVIAGFLYYRVDQTLENEFRQRVLAQSREASQLIQNKFHFLEAAVNRLALDNTLRVTMMLGAHKQLDDHLQQLYGNKRNLFFSIRDIQRDKIFTTIPSPEISLLEPVFDSQEKKVELIRDVEKNEVKLRYIIPISRQQQQIGEAAGELILSSDLELLEIVGINSCKLIFNQDGHGWDMLTGKDIDSSFFPLETSSIPSEIFTVTVDNLQYLIIKSDELPGLYFLESLNRLKNEKASILYSVFLPTGIIICLSLFISYFISRKIAQPIQSLSRIASEISRGDRSPTIQPKQSSIIEVDTLQQTFFDMLEDLETLREKERYQELFNSVADMVIIHGYDGRIIEANRIARKLLGIEITADKPLFCDSYVSNKHLSDIKTNMVKFADSATEDIIFNSSIVSNKKNLPVECHSRKIHYLNEDVILTVIRDISDRVEAENALKTSHHTLMTILDSINATIYVTDPQNHNILFMNKYLREALDGNFEGQQCYRVLKRQDTPCDNCNAPQLLKKHNGKDKVINWESYNEETEKWYLNSERLISWIDGRKVKVRISFDISELKQLENERAERDAELRHAQKMQAIGTLAGGVAHDLNNILSGIVSYPDLLLLKMKKDDPLRPQMETIKNTGVKAAAIVQDLLTLARRGVVATQAVNLNEIISEFKTSHELQTLSQEKPGVEITFDLAAELPNILGSKVHLEKTIMNLVSNSIDAIEDHGWVTISTRAVVVEAEQLNQKQKAGDYILLTIADNGCGISEEDSDRIFEPFFTTKVMGKSGTGLGMAVIWGTVEDHEGFIKLESAEQKGSTFRLYFPVTRKELIKEQLAGRTKTYDGTGESILIIDDVNEQRMIASMILKQLGYSPHSVASGTAALEYLQDHTVNLLLLDMIMDTGPDGLETYQEILKLHPGQKAIITTGYSNNTNIQEALDLGAGLCIKKPYLLEEIAAAVRRELDSP